MSITNLLNPEGEDNQSLQMRTNEEIFALVQDDQDESEDDEPQRQEPPIPRPSKKEMCNLICRALRYLEDVDDGHNDRLADLLESYQNKLSIDPHFKGQQTGIKDYFNPVIIPTTLSSCTKDSQNPPVALTSAVTLD
ncbi:hypothetical protein Pst134EB_002101 [Puccinia striiformis f. sp. tritici]|nr:hypothetical protein Pst134EB_002101 [Puccinia striiformis f. sp. tritici]